MASKRKATSQLTGPTRPAPQSTTPLHLQTIETLDPIDCAIPLNSLTTDNLSTAFPSLSPAQQHFDLWTVFQAPVFRHGSPLAAHFQSWVELRGITVPDLMEWRHGVQVHSLDKTKPSGAKIATSAVKCFRIMQSEAPEYLLRALWMKEFDYLLFMRATQLHNIDNMIPGHGARIEELIAMLKAKENVPAHSTPEKQVSSQSSDNYDMAMTFQVANNVELPAVVGHDDLAKKISQQMTIPALFGHLLDPADRIGSQTFLLFGPPGTGKTLFAQSLAKEHDMTFFKVDNAMLASKLVGETEKYNSPSKVDGARRLKLRRIIKALTEIAIANTPCLIFFDEIDGLVRERQESESSFDRRFKNRLLEMFNQLTHTPSAIIVGATNRPWEINNAFLSKFQQKIFFSLPKSIDYRHMLREYLRGKRSAVQDYQIDLLCALMLGYSGREVANALSNLHIRMFTDLMESNSFVPIEIDGATYYEPCEPSSKIQTRVDKPFHEWPVESLRPREISWEDVQAALAGMKPTITDESLERYGEWASKYGANSV